VIGSRAMRAGAKDFGTPARWSPQLLRLADRFEGWQRNHECVNDQQVGPDRR